MIKFCTYAEKRFDFLPMQYKTIEKFIADPFEYLIFNNAQDENVAADIQRVGQSIGGSSRVIRVTERNHNTANEAHAQALNWSYQNVILKESCDYVVFIDFDMFLMTPLSIVKFMENYDLIGNAQQKGHVQYFWPGLLFLKLANLKDKESINLFCGQVDGISVDAGGQFFNYLRSHPDVKKLGIYHTSIIQDKKHLSNYFVEDIVNKYVESIIEPNYYKIGYGFEIYYDLFLHYGRGTNWDHMSQDIIHGKNILINEIIERILLNENIFLKGK